MRSRPLPSALLALLFGLAACAPTAAPTQRLLQSQGRSIPVDIRLPGKTPAPVIILVPGRAGLTFYGDRLDRLATMLVDRGFVTMIPQYMDRSPGGVPETVDAAVLDLWRRTVADAVGFAATLRAVDERRIGVAGYSLGAFAAGVQAAQDSRIKALAVNSAGLSDHFPAAAGQMPPTIILHARGDPVVPLANAQALAETVRALGGTAQLSVYEANEHVLTGEAWERSAEEVVAFLEEQLLRRPGGVAR